MTARSIDNLCRIVKASHEHIDDIAKSRSRITYAMSKMQPSFVCFQWSRTLTIFHFFNRVVMTFIDNDLLVNNCLLDTVRKPPTDSATRTSIDESILRASIERIFAIYKFRMKNNITLLVRFRL